jgi:hypothetical protein
MAIADQVENEHDAFSHVREIELSQRDAIEEADQVLAEIVRANRRATSGELAYFQSELRWDERQVKNELRRMGNVVRDRAIAGTASDRAAAQAEAEVADGILQREGVKVAGKIAELQAKLSAMERDSKLSSQRVVDQAEAIERLRNNSPQHIRDGVRHRENELAHGIGRQLSDAETRLNEIDCCLDPSRYPSEATWLETLERSCRDAVEQVLAGQFIRRRKSEKWPAIQAELEAERERLQVERDELKAEIAGQEQEIRKALDFYAAAD